jgi:hypothetical protein
MRYLHHKSRADDARLLSAAFNPQAVQSPTRASADGQVLSVIESPMTVGQQNPTVTISFRPRGLRLIAARRFPVVCGWMTSSGGQFREGLDPSDPAATPSAAEKPRVCGAFLSDSNPRPSGCEPP